MKKLIVLLLAAVICFALVACGKENQQERKDNNADILTSEIAPTEPEDAPLVETELAATEPVITETIPTYIDIELTVDNWFEFFEVVEIQEYVPRGFRDFDAVKSGWYLILKPEYNFAETYQGTVIFDVQFNQYDMEFNIDHESQELYTIGDKLNITESTKMLSIDWRRDDVIAWRELDNDHHFHQYYVGVSDFVVLAVSGDTAIQLEQASE